MKNDVDVKELLNTCLQKIIDGYSIRKLTTMLRKEYDCNEEEVLNLIGAVKKFVKDITSDEKDILIDANIQRVLRVYEIAMAKDNLKVAKDALDILNKMQSAYTQKIDATVDVSEFHFKFGE